MCVVVQRKMQCNGFVYKLSSSTAVIFHRGFPASTCRCCITIKWYTAGMEDIKCNIDSWLYMFFFIKYFKCRFTNNIIVWYITGIPDWRSSSSSMMAAVRGLFLSHVSYTHRHERKRERAGRVGVCVCVFVTGESPLVMMVMERNQCFLFLKMKKWNWFHRKSFGLSFYFSIFFYLSGPSLILSYLIIEMYVCTYVCMYVSRHASIN